MDNSTTLEPIIFSACTKDMNVCTDFSVLIQAGNVNRTTLIDDTQAVNNFSDQGYIIVYNQEYFSNGKVCQKAEVTLDASKLLNGTVFVGELHCNSELDSSGFAASVSLGEKIFRVEAGN